MSSLDNSRLDDPNQSLKNKMFLDGTFATKPHGGIAYAINKALDSTKTKIVNEQGFDLQFSEPNELVCGAFNTNTHIVYFTNDNTYCKIKVYNTITNTNSIVLKVPINSQYNFNFSQFNPIVGYACYNGKDELLVVFADGISNTSNPLKFYNCTNSNLPSGVDSNSIPNVLSEVSVLEVTPDLSVPTITYKPCTEDGYLETGSYIVTIAYKILDVITGCLNYSNPIVIIKDKFLIGSVIEGEYNKTSGNKSGITSSKSINLELNDVPSYIKELKVGIELTKDSTKVYYSNILPFNVTSKQIKIQGLGEFIASTYSDVFNVITDIKQVNAITNFDNKSIIGNFKTSSQIKYQPFANNIKVYWQTKLCTYGGYYDGNPYIDGTLTYKNDTLLYTSKSFLPEEVYGIYISLITKKGIETEKFLISGRGRVNEVETSITSIAEELLINPTAKYYQLRSSYCEYQGVQSTIDDVEPIIYTGNIMGYWENEDEYYPNTEDWDIYTVNPDGSVKDTGNILRNKRIRHHRMPSQSVIETDESGYWLNNDYRDNNSKPILGIKLEDIYFPQEILNEIQGYRIYYSKRSLDNSTIQDEIIGEWINKNHDLEAPYDNYQTPRFDGLVMVSGNPSLTYNNRLTCNPFHTLSNNNPLLFTFLRANYAFKAGTTSVVGSNYRLDYTAGSVKYRYNGSLFSEKYLLTSIFSVTDKKVLSPNELYNSINNKNGQRTIGIITNGDLTSVLNRDADDVYINFSLCIYKKNMYYAYDNQMLVPLTDIIKTSITYNYTTETYNGDTYIGSYCNRQTKITTITSEPADAIQSKLFPAPFYSNSHLEFRHRETNDYFPLLETTDDPGVFAAFSTSYYSPYNYNKDISSKLSIITIIYNHLNKFTNHFPFRFMISNPNTTEGNGNGIREFSSLSYIDTEGVKGAIVSLNASPFTLYIQKEFTLNVINLRSEMINGDNSQISIQQQDIFNVQLDEILNTELGYIGTKERFANVVTPFGYIMFDSNKSRVFITDGKEARDITIGIINYLKSVYDITTSISNPLLKQGVHIGYNPLENKILLTLLTLGDDLDNEFALVIPSISKSVTLSYDLDTKGWLSFHNYFPNIYIHSNSYLYTIRNSKSNNDVEALFIYSFYKHNSKSFNCKYYIDYKVGTQRFFNDIIDYNFNSIANSLGELQGANRVKIANNFEINAEVYDNLDTIQYDKSINKLMIYNDSQCSAIIDILPIRKELYFKDYGYSLVNNKLFFNRFKDIVTNNKLKFLDSFFMPISGNLTQKNILEMSKFISTFVIIRMIHNNTSLKETIYINNVFCNFTPLNL